MAGMLEYKCPCCDGAIKFDSTTQKMKCPYCDTEFEVDTLKGYDEDLKDQKPSEMNWATPGGSWAEGEPAGLHTHLSYPTPSPRNRSSTSMTSSNWKK